MVVSIRTLPRFPGPLLRLALLTFLLFACGPGNRAVAQDAVSPPLFWADGIYQISELDEYKATGFNTVVVRLTWTPSVDGTLFANDLAPQQQFAAAAAQRGMRVIYALPPAPTGLEINSRISPDSASYITLWTAWTQSAIKELKSTPNLYGWMLPDDPRGLRIYDDNSFGNWLESNFANVQALDKQWKTEYRSFDEVTLNSVAQIVEAWQGYGPVTGDISMDEVRSRLQEKSKSIERDSWAFHPASLAVAQYKWDLYRRLLQTWVDVVKSSDPDHLVLSGKCPDYAQLLSLPKGIDISQPDLQPYRAEGDIVTHNPQGIDIARRGGQFRVMPMLTTQPSAMIPEDALPMLLPRWIQESCARGATGIGLTSWPAVKNADELGNAVKETFQRLQQLPYSDLWNQSPVNTTAILLTPLADGVTVQLGTPPMVQRRGLYGFAEDLVSAEPSDLVWALRWGSAYGGVDYFGPDDLASAPLDRYSTILMPQAYYLSNQNAARLGSFSANGGVLLADLGMGAVQNGYRADSFSPTLAAIFGVSPPPFTITSMGFNLNGYEPHRLFGSWAKPMTMRPGLVLTAGDGSEGAAFDGPVGYSPVMPQGTILATAPQFNRPFRGSQMIFRAPISIHELGSGAAVFAPFRLWNHWRPGNFGFDNFHGDLFGRGTLAAVVNVNSLVPLPRLNSDGSTIFPELLNHMSGLVLANHGAPNQPIQKSVVQTTGTGDWLWRGGIVSLPNLDKSPMVGGRPSPTTPQSELEGRTRPVFLYTALKPGAFEYLSMRPIGVQNLSGGPIVGQVIEEKPQSLKIHVWPNSGNVLERPEEWQPVTNEPATVRVTVVSADDGYSFEPGSQHRCTITDYAKGPDKKGRYSSEQKLITATNERRLTLEFSGSACEVVLTPASTSSVTSLKQR